MDHKGSDMEETQKKMMELLVSRTLRKHGVKKGKANLTEEEKEHLRSTIELLRKQVNEFTGKTNVTEHDVNPHTNVYEDNRTEPEIEPEIEQPKAPRINRLAQRRKNRRLE
ncbi:hypothetical protein D0466_01090 [Peribacillus glennii]|uniref:Spore coat protein n=2 Tax=Peribacillus glennii TaxID=2303991 RepID=A0A372LJX7_9BACI|nr:hypothetical protein D0466_01090 [Peribacillus glennii]